MRREKQRKCVSRQTVSSLPRTKRSNECKRDRTQSVSNAHYATKAEPMTERPVAALNTPEVNSILKLLAYTADNLRESTL